MIDYGLESKIIPGVKNSVLSGSTVLLTGATGRIGRIVLIDLISRGFKVRATSSKNISHEQEGLESVDWRYFDFQDPGDFDDLVRGCLVTIHLAVEMASPAKMWKTNVTSTGLLAAACERQSVAVFCYMSSISVYGSALTKNISETSPVISSSVDLRSEYLAIPQTRAYGRSKMGGELAIRNTAASTRYLIVRPSVVVNLEDVIHIRSLNVFKRMVVAHRVTHHIYVGDVSDIVIWLIERTLASKASRGSIQVYNLSDNSASDLTFSQFMGSAFRVCGDRRFRVYELPSWFDRLYDFFKARTLTKRKSFWQMRFDNKKLIDTNYKFRFGMNKIHKLALSLLIGEK